MNRINQFLDISDLPFGKQIGKVFIIGIAIAIFKVIIFGIAMLIGRAVESISDWNFMRKQRKLNKNKK